MKKVKKDAPRQARRQRALDRFNTYAACIHDAGYMARKALEYQALHRNLGLPFNG